MRKSNNLCGYWVGFSPYIVALSHDRSLRVSLSETALPDWHCVPILRAHGNKLTTLTVSKFHGHVLAASLEF